MPFGYVNLTPREAGIPQKAAAAGVGVSMSATSSLVRLGLFVGVIIVAWRLFTRRKGRRR